LQYIPLDYGSESKISSNVDKKMRKQAEFLHKAIEGQIKNNIEGFKYLNYNPNTKGADYEKVICDLLNTYLSSRFEFYTRAQIVDIDMRYTRIFQGGAREIDVVGTFNTTTPKIFLRAGHSVIMPYDAIALLAEVKSVLTKKRLEEDLEKLEKIMQLRIFEKRFLTQKIFGTTQEVFGFEEMRPDKPFRLLVYFKTPKDSTIMEELLSQYSGVWDAVFLVDKENVILNKDLPFAKALLVGLPDRSPNSKFMIWKDFPLSMLLLAITRTIPIPLAVDVMTTLFNITKLALNQPKKHRANGSP
jgi:hypothetical protein